MPLLLKITFRMRYTFKVYLLSIKGYPEIWKKRVRLKWVCVHVQNGLCVLFQVSDVEKILGIVQTENIQVTAEAYDIALDISPGRKCNSLHSILYLRLMFLTKILPLIFLL